MHKAVFEIKIITLNLSEGRTFIYHKKTREDNSKRRKKIVKDLIKYKVN